MALGISLGKSTVLKIIINFDRANIFAADVCFVSNRADYVARFGTMGMTHFNTVALHPFTGWTRFAFASLHVRHRHVLDERRDLLVHGHVCRCDRFVVELAFKFGTIALSQELGVHHLERF